MERRTSMGCITGTKLVSQTSQVVVSSGIPALDDLLGGGLPMGTVALIEEDIHGSYSKLMFKYFVAEGLVSNHSIFVASQDSSPHDIIKEMPAVIKQEESSCDTNFVNSDRMKIAFRYENLPTRDIEKVSNLGHFYDLTKQMIQSDIENSDITYWDGSRLENGDSAFQNPAYNDLLKAVKDKIKNGKFFLKDCPPKRNVLRIGILSIGSPMWLPHRKSLRTIDTSRDLNMFIFCLRALVRSALAVAVVTIPSHLYRENSLERCVHSSDISMRLQAFAGTELESNNNLSQYHGFFHLTKLAPINSFASKHPGSVEYAFKLRRKRFTIEKLHLPPDFADDSENKKTKTPNPGCFSSTKHLLEF